MKKELMDIIQRVAKGTFEGIRAIPDYRFEELANDLEKYILKSKEVQKRNPDLRGENPPKHHSMD